MQDDEIQITLEGPPGTTDPRAVAEAITALDKLLRNIAGDEKALLQVSELSTGSAVVSVRCDRQRVELLRAGLDELASATTVPAGWNAESVSALIDLESVSKRAGVEAILLRANDVVRSIDRALADHAEASIAPGPPALGSVRGKLYRYNGLRQTAGVTSNQTGQVVQVRFPSHLTADVRSALDHEVELWGEVERNKNQRVHKILISGLEVVESSRAAVTLDEVAGILGPDWTEGLDAVDWVRRQRE